MVEYLRTGKHEIPVRINRRAIVLFEKQTKKGIANIGDMNTETLTRLLFLGVTEGYRFTGETNPFKTFDDFENELDEMPLSDFYEQSGAVISSFFQGRK
jgi:hypothetical protein